jgi:NAD+ synthase (glutamine-hydrolysing)
MKICVAQLEIIPGEPELNTNKILAAIDKAESEGADLLVTSEMSIPGYLIGDNWERLQFIDECERYGEDIIRATRDKHIAVIFGNIAKFDNTQNEDGRVRKSNMAILAANGEILGTQIKTLQPNYREFDDNRHFYDKRKLSQSFDSDTRDTYTNSVFTVNGVKIGMLLCEDGWNADYPLNPIEYFETKPDLIVNISCSPFTSGKNNKRHRIFAKNAIAQQIPILYVNNVGVQNNGKNIFTFDGGSCIYDKQGNIRDFYELFEEATEIFDIDLISLFENTAPILAEDIGALYQAIEYGARRFMESHGITKVVIGVSGGIDSCLVTAIMSRIVKPENLYLINMPSEFNSKTTISIAEELHKSLGCKYYSIPIGASVELTQTQIRDAFGEELSEFSLQNVQARDRSSRILSAIAQHVGGVFTCNGNKSELTVGYCTMLGDLSGFLAPIADLWKTQVYEMAEYFNQNIHNIIPEEVFTIVPSAELSATQNVDEGKGDPIIYKYHDKLFASWVEKWDRSTPEDFLEWLQEGNGVVEKNLGLDFELISLFSTKEDIIADLERWWNLYNGLAIAKRIQSPPLISVSRRSFGFDLRESQMKAHYSRRYYELKKAILG